VTVKSQTGWRGSFRRIGTLQWFASPPRKGIRMSARAVQVYCLFILVLGFTAFESTSGFDGRAPQRGGVESANFVVYASDWRLANLVSQRAEEYRKALALEWTGRELAPWSQKCPIEVELGGASSGETSFAFVSHADGRGYPIEWQMKIRGPYERILDSVLPHEITHTIFATHFGEPLPRWADEGACTMVEHELEKNKNHQLLMQFLHSKPSMGIPFNRMFVMRRYPRQILPLYAQGYSVAKFLIHQGGKQRFVEYIGQGLRQDAMNRGSSGWSEVTAEFYGYEDLSELQTSWLKWVGDGSDEVALKTSGNEYSKILARASIDSTYAINSTPSVKVAALNMGGAKNSYSREGAASLLSQRDVGDGGRSRSEDIPIYRHPKQSSEGSISIFR
jgi:hypothetical protein